MPRWNVNQLVRTTLLFFTRRIESTKEMGTGDFLCPKCEKQTDFKHLRDVAERITFLFLFPVRSLDEIVREYVVCVSCQSELSQSILLDVSNSNIDPDSSLKNVVTLSESAATEIENRILNAGFAPQSYVRIIPEKAGTVCRIECDAPYVDDREWLGRSCGYSIVIDRDAAEMLFGTEVHFDGQSFCVRAPQSA
jgi:hypothetical protein